MAVSPIPNSSVLEYRVTSLEAVVGEVRTAVKSIDNSLQSLTRIEMLHTETRDEIARMATEMDQIQSRLRDVELDLPTLRMVRHWVIAAVLGVISMAFVTLVSTTLDNQSVRTRGHSETAK